MFLPGTLNIFMPGDFVFMLLKCMCNSFIILPTLIPYLSAIFYNNLTTCHKELQVFPELMDNHCVIHVIHQVILEQLQEYNLFDIFH